MSTRRVRRPYWEDTFFQKEEAWLNDMAAEGWNVVRPGVFSAVFEQGTPGEWVYRIQLLPEGRKKPGSTEYFEFMRSTGVELVYSRDRLAYFRKCASEGSFELFTDLESRSAYLRNLRTWWIAQFTLMGVLLILPISNLLPPGRISSEPTFDWVFLSLFAVLLTLTFIAFTVRLRGLDRQLRELEEQQALVD